MSDIIQSPSPVIVKPKPPQTYDPKDIVEATKGYMPLTNFSPNKPYEDWQGFLEKQRDTLNQERERVAAEDPKTFFKGRVGKLEDEKSKLEQRHESDLESRLSDLKQQYEDRLADREQYHTNGIARRDDEVDKLEAKIQELESETKSLETRIISDSDQRLEENKQHYEARIVEMEQHRTELREVLQTANQEAWTWRKNSCKRIQEVMQAQESECRISKYLRTGFWNGFIGRCIVIVISISFTALALALIYKFVI